MVEQQQQRKRNLHKLGIHCKRAKRIAKILTNVTNHCDRGTPPPRNAVNWLRVYSSPKDTKFEHHTTCDDCQTLEAGARKLLEFVSPCNGGEKGEQ